MAYNFKSIEQKWQDIWRQTGIYKTDINSNKEKAYLLVEFPYPSGSGLHVGHVRSYTAMDIVARKMRSEDKEVLYPMGWDAFGLPAENYAIKTGIHPSISTKENIENFRRQLQACGFSFDWDREVDTTDPNFYKWSQWIFLKLYENGLAYKKPMLVNWCPKDKCVLANEEVVDGCCERCGTSAEKRDREQWMLAITKYAERLDHDLDDTVYLPKIKAQQRNWIGMSEGSEITFQIKTQGPSPALPTREGALSFSVFTTRADTIFGCTYCVLAPEHALVDQLIADGIIKNGGEVIKYREAAKLKKDFDRSAEGKEKTGVRLEGVMAINPASGEELPLFIADYVLPNYGTGAIMAVPAHDERDYAFAKKFNLEIKEVVETLNKETEVKEIFTGDGVLVNSDIYNDMSSEEARRKITEEVGGKVVKKSKLRDWVFARQRYWGEPIPIVYDENNVMYPVAEIEFPITLPMVDRFEPTDTGESPLALAPEWVYVYGSVDENGHFISCKKIDCEHIESALLNKNNIENKKDENSREDLSCKRWRRETDTMPQWAGSSWYFMRYIDTHNDMAIGAKDLLTKWLPVDWYNGGMEHTTLHLLYSRFWYKFLYDIGVAPTSEPYYKRTSQGMILGSGGVKMSKSLGNVVNPDTVIEKYGADVLRVYEMFMGPFDQAIAWDDKAIIGAKRFLDRVESFSKNIQEQNLVNDETKITDTTDINKSYTTLTNQTIKAVTEGIDSMGFNTCISAMMIWLNQYEKEGIDINNFKAFIKLLSPFAPHLTEEIWETLNKDFNKIETKNNFVSIHQEPWPMYDESMMIEEEIVYALQINGKLRDTFVVHKDDNEEIIKRKAQATVAYEKYVGTTTPKKVIYVKGKLVNVVV